MTIGTMLFAWGAAYLGVGSLLVYEMEFAPRDRGWRGQAQVFAQAMTTAATWPHHAWTFLRDMRNNG
ncbi:MAG TPA: hypothetical protein VEH84_15500 [Alphaproteobacteria bacterium]|nr:hypothetical protein [Alphaproteobacteria bacterium]